MQTGFVRARRALKRGCSPTLQATRQANDEFLDKATSQTKGAIWLNFRSFQANSDLNLYEVGYFQPKHLSRDWADNRDTWANMNDIYVLF